jgi:hypothetical protein
MIIFGMKAHQLAKETLFESCQNCKTQNSIDLFIFQKYAHVFWLPFFPLGKIAVTQCQHCKQSLTQNEMPPSFIISADDLKSKTNVPFWTFTGLAIVALFFLVEIISDNKQDAKNNKLILSPQPGDIFEVKTTDNQYSLFKIQTVTSDSVFIRLNQYQTNMESGLGSLKRKGDSSYSDEIFSIARAQLKIMVDKGEIINIERK